jgi:hypothetical protein
VEREAAQGARRDRHGWCARVGFRWEIWGDRERDEVDEDLGTGRSGG